MSRRITAEMAVTKVGHVAKPRPIPTTDEEIMAENPLVAEARVLDAAGMADVVIGNDPKDRDERLFGPEWEVRVVLMANPESEGASVVSINGRTKSFRYNQPTIMREAHIKLLEDSCIENERKVFIGDGTKQDQQAALLFHRGWRYEERPNGRYLVQRQRRFLVERIRPVRQVLTVNGVPT